MKESITYQIIKHLGTIRSYPDGTQLEVNIVSWNHAEPKFDIRNWSANHATMERGLTLEKADAEKVAEILTDYFKE